MMRARAVSDLSRACRMLKLMCGRARVGWIVPDAWSEATGTVRRLCDTFRTLGGGQLAGPTFTHALDPQWPLCAFEHAPRGACHDAACAAQMTVDFWLPPKLALESVVKLAARSDQVTGFHALVLHNKPASSFTEDTPDDG